MIEFTKKEYTEYEPDPNGIGSAGELSALWVQNEKLLSKLRNLRTYLNKNGHARETIEQIEDGEVK